MEKACSASRYVSVQKIVLTPSLTPGSEFIEEEEEDDDDDGFSYGSSPSCSDQGSSPCASPCCSDHGFVRPSSSPDAGPYVPGDNYTSSILHDGHGSSDESFSGLTDDGSARSTSLHGYGDYNLAASPCNCGFIGCHISLCHSSESAKSLKHLSYCRLSDSYECSTSSYNCADAGCAFPSCHSAGHYTTFFSSSPCRGFEREKGMKHFSSCRFTDSQGCSSSSYDHVDEGDAHGIAGHSTTCCCSHPCCSCEGKSSMEELSPCTFGDGCECGSSAHTYAKEGCAVSLCHTAGCCSTICDNCAVQNDSGKLHAFEPDVHRTRLFQRAVDGCNWNVAEGLLPLANNQRLNDWLCIVVDSFWFLCTHKELYNATQLMEKLVKAGASGFRRAALRTSFLASCGWACQSSTRDLDDMVIVLADRLQERLQECRGYEISNAEADAKVMRMAEWALERIDLHCRAGSKSYDGEVCSSTPLSAQLQLRAFKRFLELAGNRLSGENYTEAFDSACYPLTLFSTAIDSGWASGVAASAMQGLLGMLVEGGAGNVNQCFLEAARSGSTELVRMLLQIAQRNGIEVDVDLALGYASHHSWLGTMECLVDEGNAVTFLGPLIRAADLGCMPVVKWFVERGCQDTELCLGLTVATSSNRVEVVEYFIKCIPLHVLCTLSLDIIKAAAERSGGCLKGITFLFQYDFLGGCEATYDVADRISKLEGDSFSDNLKLFCKHEWSNEAFLRGRKAGEDHYLNVLRIIHHGSSPLQLKELPPQLQVAIAYLPLYKECSASCGKLLSQWLRGQLVEAVLRLDESKCYFAERLMEMDKSELVAILKARLPTFFVGKY